MEDAPAQRVPRAAQRALEERVVTEETPKQDRGRPTRRQVQLESPHDDHLCQSPRRSTTRSRTRARPTLDDSTLYFNREISWLDFNDRVLQRAEDTYVPLLERMNSARSPPNMDEFFMVRVAGLHDQLDAGIDARGPDGLSAGEAVDRIKRGRERHHRPPQTRCLEQSLVPGLAEHGVVIASIDEVSDHASPRARGALHAPDLPGAHAAGRRARAPVPLHLQPLAVARRPRPRPVSPHAPSRA